MNNKWAEISNVILGPINSPLLLKSLITKIENYRNILKDFNLEK